MKTFLWSGVAWALGIAGLAGALGCAQQQLGGGAQNGDGGCGAPGKITCTVPVSCTATTTVAPVCTNGSWTCPPDLGPTIGCEPPICPASLASGCTCDPATGVTTCRDAGATCPADAPDGSIRFCVHSCSDPSALLSTCDGGVWGCPPGNMDLRDCSRDAGATNPTSCPPYGTDGGLFACTYSCANDTGVNSLCVAGAWQCPSGAFKASLCPPPSGHGG